MAKSTKNVALLIPFWFFFLQHIQTLFVTVTQFNKQKICLSLKKYPISLLHVTKELGKKAKTNILLNLKFTTSIKLLWGTFNVLLCSTEYCSLVHTMYHRVLQSTTEYCRVLQHSTYSIPQCTTEYYSILQHSTFRVLQSTTESYVTVHKVQDMTLIQLNPQLKGPSPNRPWPGIIIWR